MDLQSHILLWEDHTERSLNRAKRQTARMERAYWRVYSILGRMNGPHDFNIAVPMDVWRTQLDAYARVRDRLHDMRSELETLRRIESDWASDLVQIRADLARIDELHELQEN